MPLSAAVPALAAWRRRQREQSVAGRWRYRVSWVPVAGLGGDGVLGGRWLLVVPAGAGSWRAGCRVRPGAGGRRGGGGGGHGGHGGCGPAGAGPAGAGGDAARRWRLAGRSAGWCRCWRWMSGSWRGAQACRSGVAGSLVLVQALGDAGIGARLWVLTCGAVAAGGETGRPRARCRRWCGGWAWQRDWSTRAGGAGWSMCPRRCDGPGGGVVAGGAGRGDGGGSGRDQGGRGAGPAAGTCARPAARGAAVGGVGCGAGDRGFGCAGAADRVVAGHPRRAAGSADLAAGDGRAGGGRGWRRGCAGRAAR